MNLNPFSFLKKTSKGFIGLLLRENDGVIMYLESDSDSSNLVKIDSEKFTLTNRWDHLADDVDDALYKLEVRTKKTFDDIIFFVYSHLVEPETHELKKQHLSSIKNLVKSMELKPMGFIEVHEAYLKYLFDKDHQGLTALLIESDRTNLTVFIYQSGKLIAQVSTMRKKSFLHDLNETLASIKESHVLPSRIVMLPSTDHQEGADLVEHTWDDRLFNHQPSITLATEDNMINGLIYAFATQMQTVPMDRPTQRQENKSELEGSEDGDLDEELALDQSTNIPEARSAPTSTISERMGFEIGGVDREDSEEVSRSELLKSAFRNPVESLVRSALLKFSEISTHLSKLKVFRSRRLFIHSSIIIGILLILIGAFLMELNLHTAVITMTLPSQKLEISKSFDATAVGILVATETAKFDTRVAATGIKNIGQPAKGTVTIYNSSLSQGKNFSKGTVINGPGNLSFTLDADVKIASASGDAADIVSSTVKSAVTASVIGPESNLASGTKFSVADESGSSVIAKNDGSFTGGTKTQIQVVSDKDIAKSEEQIKEKARQFAKDKAAKSLTSDALLLSSLTGIEIQSKNADKAVGTEAESVTVKAEVVVTYSYVSKEKLKLSLIKVLLPKVQKGLVVESKNLSYKILSVTNKNGVTQLLIKATVRAVPPDGEKEMISSMVGKTTSALQELAKDRYHAQSVEFVVEHPIALFKNILPPFSNNIKLRLLYP